MGNYLSLARLVSCSSVPGPPCWSRGSARRPPWCRFPASFAVGRRSCRRCAAWSVRSLWSLCVAWRVCAVFPFPRPSLLVRVLVRLSLFLR